MADRTAIEWCDSTINPIVGCRRTSDGCRGCYAERLAATRLVNTDRYKGLAKMTPSGPRWTGEVRFNPGDLKKMLAWKKRRKVFVCDMADLFYEGVSDRQIAAVVACIAASGHIGQTLTKRSDRLLRWTEEWLSLKNWRSALVGAARDLVGVNLTEQLARVELPIENWWAGVTIENQDHATRAIDLTQAIGMGVRFISAEPLIGSLDLTRVGPTKTDVLRAGTWTEKLGFMNHSDLNEIDWLITGGESGPTARPSHPDWFRSLRDQCAVSETAFFFKQWGAWKNGSADPRIIKTPKDRIVLNDGRVMIDTNDVTGEDYGKWPTFKPCMMSFVGKKKSGKELDGRTHLEFPNER